MHWKYGLKGEREIKHIHTPTNPQRHAQPDSHPPTHPHTHREKIQSYELVHAFVIFAYKPLHAALAFFENLYAQNEHPFVFGPLRA